MNQLFPQLVESFLGADFFSPSEEENTGSAITGIRQVRIQLASPKLSKNFVIQVPQPARPSVIRLYQPRGGPQSLKQIVGGGGRKILRALGRWIPRAARNTEEGRLRKKCSLHLTPQRRQGGPFSPPPPRGLQKPRPSGVGDVQEKTQRLETTGLGGPFSPPPPKGQQKHRPSGVGDVQEKTRLSERKLRPEREGEC